MSRRFGHVTPGGAPVHEDIYFRAASISRTANALAVLSRADADCSNWTAP
ncbi:hypothetical protein [Roseobacter weihaiensis]|nr:hypothetical protein [Roseobacter sp. H9]